MDKVFNRKKELIVRDDLYSELTKTFNTVVRYRGEQFSTQSLIKYGNDDPIIKEIEQDYATEICPESIREKHQEKYPHHWKLFRLTGKIGYKWHIDISFDFSSKQISFKPYTNDEIIWTGSAPVIEGYQGVIKSDFNKYPCLYWSPEPNHFGKEPILADINEFTTPGYKARGTWLPILIDISRLNQSDSRWVRKQLWDIIKRQLIKSGSKKPHDEYPECSFLYSLRNERTFQNYLHWYDVHTKHKIGFRLIALYERHKQANEDKGQRFLEAIKTKQFKVGRLEKGEDKVEKGVKLIYKAIHRKPYPKRDTKSTMEQYKCPAHGDQCPVSCAHLKDFMSKFNKSMPSEFYDPVLEYHDN